MNNPIHILVAEDDSDINRLLCNIIKKSGYIPNLLTRERRHFSIWSNVNGACCYWI